MPSLFLCWFTLGPLKHLMIMGMNVRGHVFIPVWLSSPNCKLSPSRNEHCHVVAPDVSIPSSLAHILCDFPLTGYHGTKPDLIFKLEQGEEPWIGNAKISHQSCPGGWVWTRNTGGVGVHRCHAGITGCRHFCLKSLNHGAVGSGDPVAPQVRK